MCSGDKCLAIMVACVMTAIVCVVWAIAWYNVEANRFRERMAAEGYFETVESLPGNEYPVRRWVKTGAEKE